MGVDCMCDIPEMPPGFCGFKAKLYTFFRDAHEPFCLGGCLADNEHSGRVRKITAKIGGYVYVYDIAFFQKFILVRDAVADYVVQRSAYAFRKAFVVQRRRDAAVLCSEIIDQPVNLLCAHARLYMGGNMVKHCRVQGSAFFYGFNLCGCFQQGAVRNNMPPGCKSP